MSTCLIYKGTIARRAVSGDLEYGFSLREERQGVLSHSFTTTTRELALLNPKNSGVSVAEAATKAFGDFIARVPTAHRNSGEFRYPKIKVG